MNELRNVLIGAAVVALLAVVVLFGNIGSAPQAAPGPSATPVIQGDFQVVGNQLDDTAYAPADLYVKAGKPIRWVIDVKQMNGHSSQVRIASLGFSRELQPGENVIELPALDAGSYTYTCRVGMPKGEIVVEE